MSSGCVQTQMRLDVMSRGGCTDGCVESHRVCRVTPPQKVDALLFASSAHPPLATPGGREEV